MLIQIQQPAETPIRLNLPFTGAQALAFVLADSAMLEHRLDELAAQHSPAKAAAARELFARLHSGILSATTIIEESRPFSDTPPRV